MKITIETKFSFTVDTSIERARIRHTFDGQPDIQQHLNELLDLVEAQEWKTAEAVLESVWWSREGENNKDHIGVVVDGNDLPVLANYGNYSDLIHQMAKEPSVCHCHVVGVEK